MPLLWFLPLPCFSLTFSETSFLVYQFFSLLQRLHVRFFRFVLLRLSLHLPFSSLLFRFVSLPPVDPLFLFYVSSSSFLSRFFFIRSFLLRSRFTWYLSSSPSFRLIFFFFSSSFLFFFFFRSYFSSFLSFHL